MPDILEKLRGTQCCDYIIDSLIGAAIEEIMLLRAELADKERSREVWAKTACRVVKERLAIRRALLQAGFLATSTPEQIRDAILQMKQSLGVE